MVEEKPDLRAIFCEALEQKSAQEVAEYLDAACGGDADLRAQVDALLSSHRDADGFLRGRSEQEDGTADQVLTEKPGAVIGPYKLRELLGEGGMGSVYVAEQETPVRRKVALKIIKPGMDSRQVLARFEAERQALALMDHPNIAKVLDAGTTGAGSKDEGLGLRADNSSSATLNSQPSTLNPSPGRPYFVMELVRGVPITEFCDQRRLDPRERLELFIQVCRAVQHAHQKGIIHRDIKPTNILVTLHDDLPVPKVIDFGVAKATGERLTEQTVYTTFNQMIGTPLYMSPEQAEMNALDVDTRSDVYSLGVLLYELLTGSTPFDSDTLREAGFDEMRRLIREVDPPRPSQRISSLTLRERAIDSLPLAGRAGEGVSDNDSLPLVAAGDAPWRAGSPTPNSDRSLPLAGRDQMSTGDPKSPVRSAVVNRAASGEGVKAEANETAKLATTIAQHRGVDQRRLHRALRGDLDWIVMKALEKDRNRRYESASALAADVQRHLDHEPIQARPPRLFASVRQWSRRHQPAVWATVATLLVSGLVFAGSIGWAVRDRATRQKMAEASASLALEKATHLFGLAQSHIDRRDFDKAINCVKRAIQIKPDWWKPHEELGKLLRSKGTPADAVISLKEAIRLNPDQATTYSILGYAAGEADALDELVAYYKAGIRRKPDWWLAYKYLGQALVHQGKPDAAITYLQEAMRLDPDNAHLYVGIGDAFLQVGAWDETIASYKEALRHIRPDDTDLANEVHLSLAAALRKTGALDEAIVHSNEVIRRNPADFWIECRAYQGLGEALADKGLRKQAITCLIEERRLLAYHHYPLDYSSLYLFKMGALDDLIAFFTEKLRIDPDHAGAHYGLGQARFENGELDLAIAHYTQAIRLRPERAASLYHHLACALRQKGALDEAIQCFEELISVTPSEFQVYAQFAELLADWPDPARRQPARALELAKEAVRLAPSVSDGVWINLAQAHYRNGQWQQASEALDHAIQHGRAYQNEDVRKFLWLAMIKWQLGDKPAARSSYSKAIEQIQKTTPEDRRGGATVAELNNLRAEAAELLGQEIPDTEDPATNDNQSVPDKELSRTDEHDSDDAATSD